eukprot:g4336.t1
MNAFHNMAATPPTALYGNLYKTFDNHVIAPFSQSIYGNASFLQQAYLHSNLSQNIAMANLGMPAYSMTPPTTYSQKNNSFKFSNIDSCGGGASNGLNPKEERRREQRRISARARRQNKRDHLERAEFECNRLGVLLQAYKLQLKPLDPQVRLRIGRSLGVLSRINRRPVWQQMMKNAQEQLRQEESKINKGMGLNPLKGASAKDIRRERNRLSAKMSRLRKRVRLEYLEKTTRHLKSQILCLQQHLGAIDSTKELVGESETVSNSLPTLLAQTGTPYVAQEVREENKTTTTASENAAEVQPGNTENELKDTSSSPN